MKHTSRLFAFASLLLVFVACGPGREEPHFRPRASAQDHERAAHTPAPSATPTPPPSSVVVAPPPSAAPPPSGPATSAPVDPRLLSPAGLREQGPATYTVELATTAGPIQIDVTRAWSPNGADRFYNLVRAGFYTDVAFFRVIDGFMAQCGIHGSPEVSRAWQRASIADDPVVQHNTRGMVSFATAGPGTRTTQFFINLVDNSRLDGMGFSPFGRVRDASMANVDRLYHGYGEGAPAGRGPQQARMQSEGNTYLRAEFPELSYIQSARVL